MTSATLHPPLTVPLKQDASIIGLVGLAHASSHFAHLLLPLMFPVFMKEFGLSYSELGLLMTLFFAVSGLGRRATLFGAAAVLLLSVVAALGVGQRTTGRTGRAARA